MRSDATECWLDEIDLPGHYGRPAMAVQDRAWLVDPANRATVAKVWERLQAAPRTLMGGHGLLTSEGLEEDGVPEWLVAHWRSIDYSPTGERIEMIPGGMVARDLERLGLGLADVQAGTVKTPRPRPTLRPRPQRTPPQRQAVEVKSQPTVVFRRRGGDHG